MMVLVLAKRNLLYNRMRSAVMVSAIALSLTMIMVEMALFLAFNQNCVSLLTESAADLWIVPRGTNNFDLGVPMSDRPYFIAKTVPGVVSTDTVIVGYADWRKEDGGHQGVTVVGFDHRSPVLGVRTDVQGERSELRRPDSVLVDVTGLEKLGVGGATAELGNRFVRVVAITSGARSVSGMPYVITDLSNVRRYLPLGPGQLSYVGVTLGEGVELGNVAAALSERLPELEVLTRGEFIARTQWDWLVMSGAGQSLALATAISFLVGLVVMSQTLYAVTQAHMPEYGTLRAIGASRFFLIKLLSAQAMICAVAGYLCAMLFAVAACWLYQITLRGTILPAVLGAAFVLGLVMCLSGTAVSARRVLVLDPAVVFRG